MRKQITAVLAIIFFLIAIPIFSDETSAVWSRIYNQSPEFEAKLAVMQDIVDLHDRSMEPVITEALKEIVYSRDDSLNFSERQLHDDLARIMIRETRQPEGCRCRA